MNNTQKLNEKTQVKSTARISLSLQTIITLVIVKLTSISKTAMSINKINHFTVFCCEKLQVKYNYHSNFIGSLINKMVLNSQLVKIVYNDRNHYKINVDYNFKLIKKHGSYYKSLISQLYTAYTTKIDTDTIDVIDNDSNGNSGNGTYKIKHGKFSGMHDIPVDLKSNVFDVVNTHKNINVNEIIPCLATNGLDKKLLKSIINSMLFSGFKRGIYNYVSIGKKKYWNLSA